MSYALWQSEDAKAYAMVRREERITNSHGKPAWSWVIGVVDEMQEESDQYNYLYGWDDADGMLEALASFVSAWSEAQEYPDSENRDMFPAECLPFLPYVDDFAIDMMIQEDERNAVSS